MKKKIRIFYRAKYPETHQIKIEGLEVEEKILEFTIKKL
jgi:hypothetical protein